MSERGSEIPTRCLRPHEALPFEPLGQKTQAVTVEPENLQDVSTLAAKHEDMPRQRLLFEHRLHLGAESAEAARHVRCPAAIQIRVPAGSAIMTANS